MDRKKIRSILRELKRELASIYGEQLMGLLLYGSYARNEASNESDIDVFVLLKKVKNPYRERQRFAQVVWELSLRNDVVISVLPIEYGQFQKKKLPVFTKAKEEGILI